MESHSDRGPRTVGGDGNVTMIKSQLRFSSPPLKSKSNSQLGMMKPMNSGLPPKSPSSVTGRLLQSSRAVVPRRRSKRRSGRKNRRQNSSWSPGSDSEESSSEEQLLQSQLNTAGSSLSQRLDQQVPPAFDLTQNRSLLDPSPNHMNVAGNADDFFSTPDLNMVSFDSSPTSAVDPLGSIANPIGQRVTSHRRARSWDVSDGSLIERANSNTCFPSIFRRQKVMSADVASVGNASDTLVMVGETGGKISGRDLHERAKAVLNAGEYDQAIVMFEALQKAQTDRFGEWHSSVGAATHNVGVVRLRMGQADKAEELFEKAVAIRQKVLGNDHLDLAASLAKLGSAKTALQKFDDGLTVLREALSIARRTLGRSNKTVAQILCHIACLYFEASELFSAQATFEDALNIYRDIFPTASDRDACMSQMTETLCNIGSIQNKRKNFTGAIDCFREALALQRGVMGLDHPRVIATLDNLGYSFSKHRSYYQALTCYKEMLTAQLSHYGSFSTECCETLKKQILLYEKMKNLDGAVKAANAAMKRVCKDTPIPETSVTYEIEQILADVKQKQTSRLRGEF